MACAALIFSAFFFPFVIERIETKKPVCEPLTIPMCRGIGYNMTTMPNHMGHENQYEAQQKILEFRPLIEVNCAPHIRHFVCTAFAPMCNQDVDYPVIACRSMCEKARKGCEGLMKKFGYGWPEKFACRSFPKYRQGKICMNPPPFEPTKGSVKKPGTKSTFDFSQSTRSLARTEKDVSTVRTQSTKRPKTDNRSRENCVNNKTFVYVKSKGRCVQRCGKHVYFDEANKQFSDVWLLIWSTTCFVSTMVTVLTYLVDRSRFKYPERPIIYLAFCYNQYSAAYLIRLIAKADGISCSANGEHLITDGLNTAGCSIVFILLYFFGMASSLWWVVLTLTWFLSAALKWSQEAIASKSTYFHAVAWVVPAIQMIVALSTRKVDADELTGLCFVGNQDVQALAGFVLAPLCIYLLIGTTFLLAGFISLFRIRSVLKDRDTNTRKLEKLMVRIGVFSVLYTLPATAVIACFVYEYSNMESWQKEVRKNCIKRDVDECNLFSRPKEEIYMVRHFMSLVVGITSGMWVWSSKTCQSWLVCYYKNCTRNYHRQPVKQQPLLVQISSDKPPTHSRAPVPEFSEHCAPSELSHPVASACCTGQNGHDLKAPL